MSRPREDYAPTGVRVGAFTINPVVTEAVGYNSNVNGLSSSGGSPTLETTAAVNAASNWSRDSLGAFLSVDDIRYLSNSAQDQTDWTASVFGSYDIGADKLSGSYTHLNLNETASDIGAVLVATPLAYNVDDFRTSYDSAEHGRFSFIPDVDITTYRFSNMLNAGVSENFRNREVYQGELTTRYELAPLRNLVLVVRGTHINYDNFNEAVGTRDSNGGTVLFGLDYSAAGLFRYQALVGYQVRQYVGSTFKNLSEPIAEAAVTWTPTLLTTVTVRVLRDIEDAADDSIAGYTYTTGRISVDHEYRRNILLNGHVQLQNADYGSQALAGVATTALQSAGTQTIYNAGVGATWLLNRRIELTATYDYNNRHGSGVGGNYTDNIAIASITFHL